MVDFFKKRTAGEAEKDAGNDQPNSLLDVVVPLHNEIPDPGVAKHDSLLSQIGGISARNDEFLIEKQAAERAELRARKAAFEQAEQHARHAAERESSQFFEEKADRLSREIERIRAEKIRQLNNDRAASIRPVARHHDQYSYQHPPNPQHQTPQAQVPHATAHHVFDPQARPADRSVRSPHNQPPSTNIKYGYPSRPSVASEQGGRSEHAAITDYAPAGPEPAQPQPYHQQSVQAETVRSASAPSGYQDRRPDLAAETVQHPHYPPPPQTKPEGVSTPYYPPPSSHPLPPHAQYVEPIEPHATGDRNYRYRQADPLAGHHPQAGSQKTNDVNTSDASAWDDRVGDRDAVDAPAYPIKPDHHGYRSAQGKPLFDLDNLGRVALGSWRFAAIGAIIGAIAAGAYAIILPNTYLAVAELLIDPRDVKVMESQLTPSSYGGETMIAYLESQLRIIESSSVLNAVIESEGLRNDPEFVGNSGGIWNPLDLILPPPPATQHMNDLQKANRALEEALSISRGNRTFIVSIEANTQSPDKSARIANAVAKAYVDGESGARSRLARDTSENLANKLTTLRQRVHEAERDVENYKAENGLISSEGKLTNEVQLSRLNEQLANAKGNTASAKARMEQAQATDLSDVIAGALPGTLAKGPIVTLRYRYATLKTNADRLSTKLGPKHPQRIAADAELSSTRSQMDQELRRLIKGTAKDYERMMQRQENLMQQVNTLKAAAAGVGTNQIKLRELERELDAHRRVYENYLLRSRETGEQEGITTSNARIITKATPPLERSGPHRTIIAGIGFIAGAILGLILYLLSSFTGGRTRSPSDSDSAVGNGNNPPPNPYDHQNPHYNGHANGGLYG